MQTFITDFDMEQNAKNLDNKRLGKQHVECCQIAMCLLEKESKWKNHPAVKMWKGYEPFLIETYLKAILIEWEIRGFKGEKCWNHYDRLHKAVQQLRIHKYAYWQIPSWLTKDFIEAHRSNLIRKNKDYYKSKFPNTKEGLDYIWPI